MGTGIGNGNQATTINLMVLMVMKTIVSMIFLVEFSLAALADPAYMACLEPESGVEIVVGGVLHSEKHWGPPNYGETKNIDSTFIAWIISRSEPVNFNGNILKRIQIPHHDATLKNLDGQNVLIVGQVWKASTPGDVTPLVISATSVVSTDDPKAVSCKSDK